MTCVFNIVKIHIHEISSWASFEPHATGHFKQCHFLKLFSCYYEEHSYFYSQQEKVTLIINWNWDAGSLITQD